MWFEQIGNRHLLVYAGGSRQNPQQGVVFVVLDYGADPEGYLAPEGSGMLTITGAEGERLILQGSNNSIYYFDVPGRKFALSLADHIPSVTPRPTYPPPPSSTPNYTDDAPDSPWDGLISLSPINTNLLYKIESGDDVDWFRFHLDTAANVYVTLTNLSGNYDLNVYSATDPNLQFSSTNNEQNDEFIEILNASANNYYVQITSADGTSSTSPYTLHFNAPQAPTATSSATDTLEPTATETATATETPTLVLSETATSVPSETATATLTPTATATPTASIPSLTAIFYLHGTGANANPTTLFLDSTAPTGSTAKYKDSTSINFNNGNLWKEVGTWTAGSVLTNGQLTTLSDLHVWLGLKNSDDQGTRFDLRAEVYKNGVLVIAGERNCIADITRNANQAKEVTVSFGTFDSQNFDGITDTLTLKILTRIGTDGAGAFCGGHSNAVGLRLYFDATSRAATFGMP
jgi:hypothetical protein